MSHRPSGEGEHLPAEGYELGSAPLHRTTSRARKITLHPNQSSSVLFAAPGSSARTRTSRRRATSNTSQVTGSPETRTSKLNPSFFLNEDLDNLGPDREEVQLPDVGQMLGIHEGEDNYAIAASMKSRLKRQLFLLMEEPSSSREAFYVHVAVTSAILFSAVLTTMSTLPSFHTNAASIKALFGFDTAIVILFTAEYLARSLAHSDSWRMYYRWATSFFAVLDLLSIVPYFVEIASQEDTSIMFRFSILRTFRLLRVFRAFRFQNQMTMTIEVMYVAFRRSKNALVAISYFIVLVLVLFSTLIYFAERGTWDATLGAFVDPDGDVSLFDSIPQTAWYALVTMSTAGYGDVVPKTALGKILSVPLLLFGLLLIALPSFVLGRNFAIAYDALSAHAMATMNGQPSQLSSTRNSIDEHRPSRDDNLTPIGEESSVPLLPVTNPSSRPRSTSPPKEPHQPQPRMWNGDPDKHTPANPSFGQTPKAAREKDLTNTKLAKNQYVLLEQIDSLRQTIDRQGEMISALMAVVAEKNGVSIPTEAKGKRRQEHFDLGGESDDGSHE